MDDYYDMMPDDMGPPQPEYPADMPATPMGISLADAKKQLEVVGNDEDDEIAALVVEATQYLEERFGYPLIRQGVKFWLPCWRNDITLRHGRVVGATVQYVAQDGTVTDLPADKFDVAIEGRRRQTLKVYFYDPPDDLRRYSRESRRNIVITAMIGLAPPPAADAAEGTAPALPKDVCRAIKLLCAHWFDNRSAILQGTWQRPEEIPFGVKAICDHYKKPWSGG